MPLLSIVNKVISLLGNRLMPFGCLAKFLRTVQKAIRCSFLAAVLLLYLSNSVAHGAPALGVHLGSVASLSALDQGNGGSFDVDLDGTSILQNQAYFTLTSVVPDKTEKLTSAFLQESPNSYSQMTRIPGLGANVHLLFRAVGNYISVQATLFSKLPDDKAWKLALHLPLSDVDWNWEPGLNTRIAFAGTAADPEDAKIYPITALMANSLGFALAVPANWPAINRFYRSQAELILEFPIGTSILTRPSNVSVVKIHLWSFNSKWGFRQALDDYYKRFPTKYVKRNRDIGLWSTATPERLKTPTRFFFHEHGNIFFSNEDSSARSVYEQMLIDGEYNWGIFPYMIWGQMSRVRLDNLPDPSADIDITLANESVNFPPQHERQFADLSLTKNDYALALYASRTYEPSNAPNILIREVYTDALDPETGAVLYRWDTMGKMVTFPVNPDPDLMVDGVSGFGSRMIQWADTISTYGVSGLYVDSLGRWGRYPNYRREHFYSTRSPLTTDATGRVYLPNYWGHYEFLKVLSNLLHQRGQLLFGNAGNLSSPGGFFLGYHLDILGGEVSPTAPITRNFYFLRCVAGPRPVLRLAAGLGEQPSDTVRRHINRNLALGFLPSSCGSYFAWPEWINVDESFANSHGGDPNFTRDSPLWANVFRVVDTLGKAAWKPVTFASTSEPKVIIERFQAGAIHYFTVLSALPRKSIKINLECNQFTNPKVFELISRRPLTAVYENGCYTVDVPVPEEMDGLSIIRVINIL